MHIRYKRDDYNGTRVPLGDGLKLAVYSTDNAVLRDAQLQEGWYVGITAEGDPETGGEAIECSSAPFEDKDSAVQTLTHDGIDVPFSLYVWLSQQDASGPHQIVRSTSMP